ncbi:hypothetical protein LINPERPRIM_LOCUS27931 [Linum perenne]
MTNNQRLTTLEENLGRVQDAQTRFATAQEQLTADVADLRVLRLCDRHPAFGRRHLWASTSTSSYILKTYRKFVRHWFKK